MIQDEAHPSGGNPEGGGMPADTGYRSIFLRFAPAYAAARWMGTVVARLIAGVDRFFVAAEVLRLGGILLSTWAGGVACLAILAAFRRWERRGRRADRARPRVPMPASRMSADPEWVARATFWARGPAGGRYHPPASPYKGQIQLGDVSTSTWITRADGGVWFEFDRETEVRLRLMFPDDYSADVHPGLATALLEGGRQVGVITIERQVDGQMR